MGALEKHWRSSTSRHCVECVHGGSFGLCQTCTCRLCFDTCVRLCPLSVKVYACVDTGAALRGCLPLPLCVCVPLTANVLQVLEEAQDVVEAEDCLDIISWLEHNSPLLSTYTTGNTQVGALGAHMPVHTA
jgi:hypothetical protein